MPIEVINPPNVLKPRGYSHAFKVGNTVYVAGEAPYDQEGKLVGKGDIIAQTEQTYSNMQKVLEAAGAKMSDIVKMTVYLLDYDDLTRNKDVARKYFKPPFPPATGVQVVRLAGIGQLIEVDAIAVIDPE